MKATTGSISRPASAGGEKVQRFPRASVLISSRSTTSSSSAANWNPRSRSAAASFSIRAFGCACAVHRTAIGDKVSCGCHGQSGEWKAIAGKTDGGRISLPRIQQGHAGVWRGLFFAMARRLRDRRRSGCAAGSCRNHPRRAALQVRCRTAAAGWRVRPCHRQTGARPASVDPAWPGRSRSHKPFR